MINAIHVEDEKNNVILLDNLMKQHCPQTVTMVGHAGNLEDAMALIKRLNPQLLFLDIEIAGGNAFQLLDQMTEYNFQVIFITAYNNYAIKAFKYNCIDYLLKPIDSNELIAAVEKASKRIGEIANNSNIAELIKYLKVKDSSPKIGIPVYDGIVFITIDDITRVEAKGNYCILYLANGKSIVTTNGIGEIENLLHSNSFLRVHNSWIINTNFLKKYYRGKNSYIEMEDGSTVNVSIRKKGGFLDFLNNDL